MAHFTRNIQLLLDYSEIFLDFQLVQKLNESKLYSLMHNLRNSNKGMRCGWQPIRSELAAEPPIQNELAAEQPIQGHETWLATDSAV